MNGKIRAVNMKGYGFIKYTDGKEYFFHRSEFDGHWNDLVDDFESHKEIQVEFDVDTDSERTKKGPRARNVKRLDWPNQVA